MKKLSKITDLIGYETPRKWLSPLARLKLDAIEEMRAEARTLEDDEINFRRSLTTIFLLSRARLETVESHTIRMSIPVYKTQNYQFDKLEKEKVRRALSLIKGQELALEVIVDNDLSPL